MGTVSDDRGPEEIPVLVELEVQHWVDEALENATPATERILGELPRWVCVARAWIRRRQATSI
jgi:hypothetical protein